MTDPAAPSDPTPHCPGLSNECGRCHKPRAGHHQRHKVTCAHCGVWETKHTKLSVAGRYVPEGPMEPEGVAAESPADSAAQAQSDEKTWRETRDEEIASANAEQLRAQILEAEPMMRWFAFDHLPERLQARSRSFFELAADIVLTVPRNPERTVSLRKLLEAKDCAVRASLAQ